MLTSLAKIVLRSVNFYFTDVSEPSHIIFARSIFILPTSRNRHSSSFNEGKKCFLSLILYARRIILSSREFKILKNCYKFSIANLNSTPIWNLILQIFFLSTVEFNLSE